MKLQKFLQKLKKLSHLFVVRRVVGESMIPALWPGQIVIASSLARPKVGSIVIFTHGGKEKIKRIRSIDDDGAEVLGDNPAVSTDSRQFGRVASKSIIAVVIFPR